MAKQRRAYNFLPDYNKTKQNDREYSVLDDVFFEPENADFLLGFIGSVDVLTEDDLARTPQIKEDTPERQKFQLTIGAALTDPDTQTRLNGAFYTDLLNQISANGGLTDDPNRIFSTNFYAWTPPIDYDKHINFSRYFWVVPGGAADVNGSYITKEPEGSRTVLYQYNGTDFDRVTVKVVASLPVIEPVGTLVEDASTAERLIYRSDGITWVVTEARPETDIPTDTTPYNVGDYAYVARFGPDYNRPLVWLYSDKGKRWISQPVVVSTEEPDTPREGMIWEDPRVKPIRILKRYTGIAWVDVSYVPAPGPSAAGADGDYIYDTRNFQEDGDPNNEITDGWIRTNWWRNFEDLSPVDRDAQAAEDQAVRPIIEFWAGLESPATDTKDPTDPASRNQIPIFNKYAYDLGLNDITSTGETTTIYQYQVAQTGQQDFVLEFPLVFNNDGEFLFDLTLESDTSTRTGYKYFKNLKTGFVHSVWHKSDVQLQQTADADGLYDVPRNLSSNPDHVVLTEFSRAKILNHMSGVIGSQDDFTGSSLGPNSYRWSDRDPAIGSTLIDSEQTLLRAMGMLQTSQLDMPNVIRNLAKEYNKVLFRFENKLTQYWNQDRKVANPDGTLRKGVSAGNITDAILTELFLGRTEDFPYYYSDMGKYVETRIDFGTVEFIPIATSLSFAGDGITDSFDIGNNAVPERTVVRINDIGQDFGIDYSILNPGTSSAELLFFSAPSNDSVVTVQIVDEDDERPIFIPPSAPRVGASPAYQPEKFIDHDGNPVLRGHDGYLVASYTDDRDKVWLEFQNRFFNVLPVIYKEESTTLSSRFLKSNFKLGDYYGNYVPETSINPVDQVVNDLSDVVAPTQNLRVFSKSTAEYAQWNGQSWLRRPAVTDDIFLNNADSSYYIFNGKATVKIEAFNRSFSFDYTDNEYRNIIRNEFERIIVFEEEDFTLNDTYDPNDRFTWNYGSAGVEGNYRGIYRRLYNTIEPHIHAWEVMGYAVEPTWWRTQYVPDSVASDGTPRYGSAHPMWANFQAGIVNPISGLTRPDLVMTAPIPVDASGNLLDPITAGIVDIETLDSERLEDSWKYGDGGPVEHNFYDSSVFAFVDALAGYLMKNGIWVDTLWSEVYITIGESGSNLLATAPHVIHRDTLTRPEIEALPTHREVAADGTVIQRLGVNAWVSEYMVVIGGSPTVNFGNIIKNTNTELAWKTSGFINQNRTIVATLSGEEIPFEDIHTISYKSQPFDTKFSSGVIITSENPGYRVYGTDPLNPFFEIDRPSIPIIGGQVERRQAFTAEEDQHIFEVTDFKLPFNTQANDTARLSVIADGLRLKPQHITVLKAEEYRENAIQIESNVEIGEGTQITVSVITTPSNPSTRIRTFKIDGVGFPYYAERSGERIQIEYGRFFSTATEVINFMLGYGRAQEEDGWVFDQMDDNSTEFRDWMFGAKRFAQWVLQRSSRWNREKINQILAAGTLRFEFSPLTSGVKFKTDFGMVENIESIQGGAYGIVDVDSNPIRDSNTFVSRSGDTLEVTATGDEEIYGVRLNIVESQHVVFFSNITRFNDIIYDPVLALFHKTLRVDSYRTNDWNGRLEADGYIVSGGELLPNFEKQAFDVTRFYDRINTPDNPTLREQARNLYGWSPNDQYMDNIEAADRSRFDYFRGMVQTKGTRRPITAYTKGTRLGQDNVFLYEDWAWRVQEFGDRRNQIVQFTVNKNEVGYEAQVIAFSGPVDPLNKILEVEDFDRKNTVVGTTVFNAGNPYSHVVGYGFNLSIGSNTIDFTSLGVTSAIDLVAEINQALDTNNIVGFQAVAIDRINNIQVAFQNSAGYEGTPYTISAGTITDILPYLGIAAGTYTIDNSRWLRPPVTGQDGISNLEFPLDSNGFPDVQNNEFFSKLFNSDTGLGITDMGHFDPEIGKYEADAFKEVDYSEPLDPARYNVGPEATFSSGLAWGDEQVGRLWWDTTRRQYVDYRRPYDGSDTITFPSPDYEKAGALWGRLLYYNANITRTGEVVTVETLDIYNKAPVAHQLETGDLVSITGANEPEWNVTDVTVDLGPVSVTGTIPYEETEAAGTVFIPSEINITGDTVFADAVEAIGTATFDTDNSASGVTGNPTFLIGDNGQFKTRDGTFNFTSTAGGTVIAMVQELNDFFVSNGIDDEIQAFNDFDTLLNVNRLGFRNPEFNSASGGTSFRLTHVIRSTVGTVPSPTFAVGDDFNFVVNDDPLKTFGFASTAGGGVAAIVAEINTRFATPPVGKNAITEIEAFNSGGFLGFRNTAGNEGVPFALFAGLTVDLLAKAGVAPGEYEDLFERAGFLSSDVGTPALPIDQEIIPGEDYEVGTGVDFSMTLQTDLLSAFGIDITTDNLGTFPDINSRERFSGTTTGTVANPDTHEGYNFEITEHKLLSFSSTINGNLAAIVSEINNQLLTANITEVEATTSGNFLRFRNTSQFTTVSFKLTEGTVNDFLGPGAGMTAGTFTDTTGTVSSPTIIIGQDFEIEVDVVVNYTADQTFTTTAALVADVASEFTAGGINDISIVDNAGLLEFQTIANEYTLFSTKRLNFVNPKAGNVTTVVGNINSALADTNITEVEAFVSTDSLGIRNSVGNDGVPFTLTAGTVNDLLVFTGLTAGTYVIIPSGLNFNVVTNTAAPATKFTTGISVSLAELVTDINTFFTNNTVAELEAVAVNNRLVFRNTAGNEGERFQLVNTDPGITTSLLEFAGIQLIPGFFSIIPALADFTIETNSSGGPQTFSSAVGGNLATVVAEINTFFTTNTITEVIAVAEDNKLIIRNDTGDEGKRFVLTAGTVNDLLAIAGITAGSYGPYPAGVNFSITTPTGTANFTSSEGGNIATIVAEINSYLTFLRVPEVQASTSNNLLTLENTTDYIGVSFTLAAGVGDDLLALVGISPGLYQTDPTQFTFIIEELPPETITGDVKIEIGAVDLYEWVSSPVPPESYSEYISTLTAPDAPTGTPLNVDDASYVERKSINDVGVETSTYYFWVKDNSGANSAKNFTTSVIARRLASPVSQGVPWSAPMDSDHMVIYTGGNKVIDGYAVEVLIDRRELDTHAQWVLVSEGDQFKEVPDQIVNKMIDSMSQVDSVGTTVPAPWLADSEKYGPNFFPTQTVFVSPTDAIEVYVTALNALIELRNLGPLDELVAIFPLADEFDATTNPNGFWVRKDYIESAYKGQTIFDTVVTIEERDRRASNDLYINGDLVKVEKTTNTDPFEEAAGNPGVQVGATYLYQDGAFLEVGIERHTIEANTNLASDTARFRNIFSSTYDVLGRSEQNSLIFSLLHEMNRQNISADWFIKTSFLSIQIFDVISQSPFIRPDESTGITANINDVKPFRSKLRSNTSTLTIGTEEDFPVEIEEIPVIKIGMQFDRLSCHTVDDGGWDAFAWDSAISPDLGWDKPFWDFEDLGRGEWEVVEIFTMNGIDDMVVAYPNGSPQLYDQRITIKDGSGAVTPIDYDVIIDTTSITVKLSTIPPSGYTVTVEQNVGFYQGGEPTLGPELEDTLFQPIGSSYEHHFARTVRYGDTPFDPRDTVRYSFRGDGFRESFEVGDNGNVLSDITVFVNGVKQPSGTYNLGTSVILVEAPAIGEKVAIEIVNVPVLGTVNYNYTGDGTTKVFPTDEYATNIADVSVVVALNPQTPGTDFEISTNVVLSSPPANNSNVIIEITNIESMTGCDTPDDETSGFPEERIPTEVIDSCKICVINTSTEALGSWDATPWDTAGWDSPPADVGDRVFFLCVGQQEDIPTGIDILPTSEDFSAVNAPYVIGSNEDFTLVEVQVQVGGVGAFNTVTEGVEYDKVSPFNNVLEFGTPVGQTFIGDGITTSFNVTIPTGAADVRLNGNLLVGGVDYLLSGTPGNETLDFSPIQPPPKTIQQNFVADGASSEADGGTVAFETNLPVDSLTSENVFVWVNNSYTEDASGEYNVATAAGDVEFQLFATPSDGDIVQLFAVGNTFSDNTPMFTVNAFSGNTVNPNFAAPFGKDETVFVFVDGVYQNPGIDYNLTAPDSPSTTVVFVPAAIPGLGVNNVEIRVLISPVSIYNVTESTFVAIAGPTTLISGVYDGDDPDQVMLFVDGVLQDIWTALGTPDATLSIVPLGTEITWNVPLVGGEVVSYRKIKSITLSETIVQDVIPTLGGEVTVSANPYLQPTDVVRFIYNGWKVGPLGPFEVQSVPAGAGAYDVIDGILTVTTPVVNDTITLEYKKVRKGDFARSILSRMPRIVEDILPDHLSYDDPLGFETFRKTGIIVVNTTTSRYYQWNGTVWNDIGLVLAADQFFVKRTCEIWEYDGASFNLLFEVGDAPGTTPHVLPYPAFGLGITYGTYATGSSVQAAIDFPEAYQIMQSPGDCG